MKENELLPCPFCGNKGVLRHSELTYHNYNCADSIRGLYSAKWTAQCSYCSIAKVEETAYYNFTNDGELVVTHSTGFNDNDGRRKAIERWNRRATDGLQKKVP